MKLTCKKCGTVLQIDANTKQQPTPRVQCSGCGTSYRLRRGTQGMKTRTGGSPPTPTSAPTSTPTSAPTSTPTVTPTVTPTATPTLNPAPHTHPKVGTAVTPGGGAPPSSITSDEVPTSKLGTIPALGGALQNVFQPGDVAAGRYRIERFLAKGGMGEVYEAEDLELRQTVALKTISSGGVGTAEIATTERFKREIALARTVTHPNVCRIFDLGQHLPPPDPASGHQPLTVSFLTMELLEGETLADFLERRGRLAPAEALPLVRQMADALDAAHRARVVHRDFKSENVFLVPEGSGFRAVVTDFGVARGGEEHDRFAPQVTGAGIVGTPAYMAPEQVAGETVTSAADLYALGIVVYEMVTGALPFTGPNPLTTAVKRLQEQPPPPHIHAPDIPGWWERAILRCLERQPERRFATAKDLADALADRPARPPSSPGTGGVPPIARAAPAPTAPTAPRASTASTTSTAAAAAAQAAPEGRRTRSLVLVLAAVVLLSIGLGLFNRFRDSGGKRIVPRRAVAVLGLENLSGEPKAAWISTALAEMLRTELTRGEALRVISRESTERMHRDLGLEGSTPLDEAARQKVRSLLASDFLIQGTYVSRNGEDLRVDLRIADLALGQEVGSFSKNGNADDLFNMVDALGTEVREALGVGVGGDDPGAGLPKDAEAARHYAEALDHLSNSNPKAAREELQRAVAREGDNPLLHAALSTAWEAEGFHRQAVEAARRAFEHSSMLPREDRLAVEGRVREAEGDWAAATDIYTKLRDLFPDDLEYGLRLAAAQNAARRLDSALETVIAMQQLPEPLSADPRIDLAEAETWALAGDFKAQLDACTRAGERAQALGAHLLLARARLTCSQAHRVLGHIDAAESTAQQALDLYRSLEHPEGTSLARTTLANALVDRGAFQDASDYYRQAIDDLRRMGDRAGVVSALNNLAVVKKRQGHLEQARALYEETLEIYHEIDDEQGKANANNNLGVLMVDWDRLDEARDHMTRALRQWEGLNDANGIAIGLANAGSLQRLLGDLAESRRLHERALEMRRRQGHELGEAASRADLALVLLDLGELDSATEHLEVAIERIRATGDRALLAHALFGQGQVRLARGQLEGARQVHEEAFDLRTALAQPLRVLESRLALAHLTLAEEDLQTTEVLARQVVSDAAAYDRHADGASALALLALALEAQGQPTDAQAAIAQAVDRVKQTERAESHTYVALADAQVRAASLPAEENLERLTRLENDLATKGYLGLRLQTSLIWGRVALAAGHTQAAHERLEHLMAIAAERGYERLAAQADQVLRQ